MPPHCKDNAKYATFCLQKDYKKSAEILLDHLSSGWLK